jgi:hypothetical protein
VVQIESRLVVVPFFIFVMTGLGPVTHEFFYLKPQTPSWVRGPSPRMTT